jgi:hypothetical protein
MNNISNNSINYLRYYLGDIVSMKKGLFNYIIRTNNNNKFVRLLSIYLSFIFVFILATTIFFFVFGFMRQSFSLLLSLLLF